ncbi:MAG: aspartate-semialdehyde dehydrogenase [Gammaproteobacteria bacterium]|nr:aspartate-semialdehyde dehydrogenase [Gammaproteobacteria bacterium]
MIKHINIAVLGATGLVGETMLELLADLQLPAARVFALASAESHGKRLRYGNDKLVVCAADDFDFSTVQVVLCSAGSAVAAALAPRAQAAGCLVIDNSSAFRNDPDKLLLVPEINGHLLDQLTPGVGAIVANPNCSTIQMLMVLAPLHQQFGLRRIHVSTYQAVSGAGRAPMEDLGRHSLDRLSLREPHPQAGQHCMAFDLWPQIDTLQENGYSGEEMKMLNESRKILAAPDLQVNATAVRVPVFNGHAMTVHAQFSAAVSLQDVHALLQQADGVRVMDRPQAWPSPVQVSGTDEVCVGRLRHDLDDPAAINCWIVADNIRKGAALNAVQIMQRWLQRPALHGTATQRLATA